MYLCVLFVWTLNLDTEHPSINQKVMCLISWGTDFSPCIGYSRQQNYSSSCDNTCDFSLVWSRNFVIIMLLINSIKLKDYNLRDIYFIKLIRYEFSDTNYFKCSNNFAADCTVGKKSIRALEIFRVQKLILNATSWNESLASHDL